MTSVRTRYRILRINLLVDSIRLCAIIITEKKRTLERVHLKYFKSVKKSVVMLLKEVNEVKSVSHA